MDDLSAPQTDDNEGNAASDSGTFMHTFVTVIYDKRLGPSEAPDGEGTDIVESPDSVPGVISVRRRGCTYLSNFCYSLNDIF